MAMSMSRARTFGHLLLPEERKVIDVFADHDRGNQAGRGMAAGHHACRRCCQERFARAVEPVPVLGTHQ